jgi:hypothetical protein
MNRRALVRAHSHWRPRRGMPTSPVSSASIRQGGQNWRVSAAACLAVVVAIVIAVLIVAGRSISPSLPATPSAWLDAFSAGVARDSPEVCSELLSPALRSAIQREAHETCATYYSHARVLSIRVLRILESGATAALEIRYWPRGGYSTFVLDREHAGWRAVAIVPGGPLPAA